MDPPLIIAANLALQAGIFIVCLLTYVQARRPQHHHRTHKPE